MAAGGADRGRERGQAAAELALALPIVALLLLVAAQAVLIGRDQVLVVHAAREAARAAAVADAGRAAAARRAAATTAGLIPARTAVDVRVAGHDVHVTVRYRAPTDLPLVGRLVGDVDLRADAVMALEGRP